MDCSACGHPNATSAKFCNECGARLASPASTGGERRQLTVMFCDLVGSTPLAEQLDPEEFGEIIAAYQSLCRERVETWEGFAARSFGDGLLVYFGYPRALEDAPFRAIRAACEIADAVPALNSRFRDAISYLRDQPLAVRVGVHTGLVVVGEITTGSGDDHVALGDTVNLAARLQGAAPAGGVLISDATRQLVPDRFETRDLGELQLKGVSDGVRAYRVMGDTGVRERIDVRGSSLTPLVGREREFAQLEDTWRRALAGEAPRVEIVGEPGVGKSRLVRNLRERVIRTGQLWVECRATPNTRGSQFRPLVDAVGRALESSDAASPEDRAQRLGESLGALGLSADECLPLLAPLLGLPVPPTCPPAPESVELRHRNTIEAFAAWASALAAKQPGVFVVEDLHWCDVGTLDVLARLRERPAPQLLTLLTYRPEFVSDRTPDLKLGPLPASAAAELVRAVLRERSLSDDVTDTIVERGEGIPLFLEELTKSLLESSASADTIPATLQDSLMARLDRLPAGKPVAQLCAAIGRRFDDGLVRAVSPFDAEVLERGIDELLEGELLYRSGSAARPQFTFKHALIQDAAYQSLLRSTRRGYHRQIAEILEASDEVPAVLAHHWEGAGEPLRAARCHREAARALGYHPASLDHWQQARALLGEVPRTPESRELLLDVCCETLTMSARGGRGELPEVARDAEDAARESGRPELEFRFLRDAGYARFMNGHCAEGLATMQRAATLANEIGDPKLRPGLFANLVQAMAYCGPLSGALKIGNRFLELVTKEGSELAGEAVGRMRFNQGGTMGFVGFWSLQAGDVERFSALFSEALPLIAQIEDPGPRALGYFLFADGWFLQGDRDQLARCIAPALETVESAPVPAIMEASGFGIAGKAALLRGDAEESLALFERSEKAGVPSQRLWHRPWLALTHLALGDSESAHAVANTALAEVHASGARVLEVPALLIYAHVLKRDTTRPPSESDAALERADALAAEVGAHYYRDHVAAQLGLRDAS